jgi:hypothetical protein
MMFQMQHRLQVYGSKSYRLVRCAMQDYTNARRWIRVGKAFTVTQGLRQYPIVDAITVMPAPRANDMMI